MLGGEEIDLTQDRRRPPAADGLAAVEGQPVLRQGLRQSRLGQLLQRRHRRAAGRSEPGQPAEQQAAARTTWPQGFIEHGFDMKWLHREICNSRTYQLSWQPNETNAKDERNFARCGAAAAAGRSRRRCRARRRSPRMRRPRRYADRPEGPGDRRRRRQRPREPGRQRQRRTASPCRSSAAAFAKATATATARWKPACCRRSICRTTAAVLHGDRRRQATRGSSRSRKRGPASSPTAASRRSSTSSASWPA